MKTLRSLAAAVLCGAVVFPSLASAASPPPAKAEQAVIVRFDYGSHDLTPFWEFEDRLENAVKASGAGDYDGNELAVDGSDGTLYMYGPSADKLFAVVKPLLESTRILKNVVVTLRYGLATDPKAREVKVRVGS